MHVSTVNPERFLRLQFSEFGLHIYPELQKISRTSQKMQYVFSFSDQNEEEGWYHPQGRDRGHHPQARGRARVHICVHCGQCEDQQTN